MLQSWDFLFINCEITFSTVVLQCYRLQAIPMDVIRPSITLYFLNWSFPNLVWLITWRPYWYANFSRIWLGGKFPTNRWNITSLWLFAVSIFVSSPREKPVNRFAQSMAQTREISQGCAFWGFHQKIFIPPLLAPKFWKFCITEVVVRSKHV